MDSVTNGNSSINHHTPPPQQQQQQHTLHKLDGDDSEEEDQDQGQDQDPWSKQPDISHQELLDRVRNRLQIERSIADGAHNLLQVFDQDNHDGDDNDNKKVDLRNQIESEFEAANSNVAQLSAHLNHLQKSPYSQPDLAESIQFPFPTNGYHSPSSPQPNDAFAPSPTLPPPPPQPQDDTTANAFAMTFEVVLRLVQRLDEMQDAADRVKAMDQIVASVISHPRINFELKLEENISHILAGLSDAAGKDVRAATYRLLRHLIVDQAYAKLLHSRHLEVFLIRSLSRDQKYEVEKEQALRLVRLLLSLGKLEFESESELDNFNVPPSVVRAIVALAENQEEKLRLACLETLGELLLQDVALLVAGEGLRVLLQTLTDGPHDFSPHLAMGFLWIIDRPSTRQYLRPGVDLEIILSGFTDMQGKGSSQEERVKASAKIIMSFVKSWSGLMYLCLNGRQSVKSLVESLTSPSATLRECLIDTLVNIFNITPPSWYKSVLSGESTSPLTKGSPAKIVTKDTDSERTNLVDQYLAVVLLVFIDAGLLEALVSVATTCKDSPTAPKVSLLIGEVLRLATRILPLSYATRVQALPKLFAYASSFDTSDARLAASSTLSSVDALNRYKSQIRADPHQEELRPRSNSLDDPLKRGQRQVETAKARMGMQIDDTHFRNLLLETQVLSTKDHTKWNLDTLTELLEGPLLNPRRLDEAMRASKFMRRLLSFFHPFNYRYSEVRKSPQNLRYTQLGCTVITSLLASPDGIRYLVEDKLLRQIANSLVQLDPIGNVTSVEILLSKKRMEETLCSGYFEMLGGLTRSAEGLQLIDQFNIWTAFYRISELRSREDLVEAVIDNMDYSIDGHPRILLSRALNSGHKPIRIFATQYLAKLVADAAQAEEWEIRLLLTQLYDPSPEVCKLAVQVLENACRSLSTLELVVRMRPTLDHLGEMGLGLLIRFLSTSIGVRYLHEIGFIEQEMEDWFQERNLLYVAQMELLLASNLSANHPALQSLKLPTFDGCALPHFFGELVKTSDGCEILASSGHFADFSEYVRQHGLEDLDSDVLHRLKSALWTVGHIGATTGGLAFLDEEYLVQCIVEIAETSPVYSVRGTAIFALSLISRTIEGVELLEEMGWESLCTPLAGPRGLCVPLSIDHLVDTSHWEPAPVAAPKLLSAPSSHLEKEALLALANLSNHILATKASKTLARLKKRHPSVCSSYGLFYRALNMLASYHYRLPVRRYILELFDMNLTPEILSEVVQVGEDLVIHADDALAQKPWEEDGMKDVVLGGLGAEDYTDDDESIPDTGVMIPLQVGAPLLSVKGFIIS